MVLKSTDEMVSVIIPVYNSEAYLDQCVTSILSNTYRNIELILVDDGSTDSSGKICDGFAALDQRVNVIHKVNGGASSARNAGLKCARGSYVTFIDNDDYIDSDYFETLVNNISEYDAVAGGCQSFDPVSSSAYYPERQDFLGKKAIREGYKDGILSKIFTTPFTILYRKETAGDLLFDESVPTAEDIIFNIDFLNRASSVLVISYGGYHYRRFNDSTTKKFAMKYTPLYEHDCYTVREGIWNAKRRWGFSEEELLRERQRSAPMRYFLEVSNLLHPGSPYDKRMVEEKIKEIHEDKDFVDAIKRRKYRELSSARKVAKLGVTLNNPRLVRILFQMVEFMLARKP